jgi:hypothetical protein
MKRIIVGLVLAATVGQASAAVGSIINSFPIAYFTPGANEPYGIARDPSYIYVGFWSRSAPDYLRSYTAAGAPVGSVTLSGIEECRFMGPCHLGAGYLFVLDDRNTGDVLAFIRKDTGSLISSFPVLGGGAGVLSPTVAWDGMYYYAAGSFSQGEFNLYDTAGSLVRTWKAAGWPSHITGIGTLAFAHCAGGASGRYLVACPYWGYERSCIVDINTGSLVATWRLPYTYGDVAVGLAYGDASPPSYGATCWVNWSVMGIGWWALQIDVDARGATTVLPASVGKIKAIYR